MADIVGPDASEQTPGAGGALIYLDPQRTACDPARYIAADAILQINAWCSAASVTLTADVYQVDPLGRPVRGSQNLVCGSTRGNVTISLPLSEGFLMGVTIKCSSSTVQPGQCFVRAAVTLGAPVTVQIMQLIIEGYVTNGNRLSWPQGQLRSTVDGKGWFHSVQGTLPAAGAEISETVPTNAIWRLISFNYSLVASATVSSRTPGFVIDDGANVVLSYPSVNPVTASGTGTFNAVAGSNLSYGANFPVNWPVPQDMWLPAGWRIRSVTTNLQAGDQYSAPNYMVEELLLV